MAEVKHKPLAVVPKGEVRKILKDDDAIPTGHTGAILQVVLNTDMRNGPDGLADLAKANGIDVNALHPGQYVVFVNSVQTRVRVYAAGRVVAMYNCPTGEKVDLRVIARIPRMFQGSGRLDYNTQLKETLEEALKPRPRRKMDDAVQQALAVHSTD